MITIITQYIHDTIYWEQIIKIVNGTAYYLMVKLKINKIKYVWLLTNMSNIIIKSMYYKRLTSG